MTLPSLSGIFTLHTKMDVPFVKHKWFKCRTAFPIKRTSSVNMFETSTSPPHPFTPWEMGTLLWQRKCVWLGDDLCSTRTQGRV